MTSTAAARTELIDITRQGLDVPALFDAATQVLQPALCFWAYCWETLDPVTLLPTSGVTHNLPPESAPAYFENEYGQEDFNKFEELVASGVAARTLFDATDGEPQRSRRYRELFLPNALGPELRAVLADGQECWGAVSFLREATADEFPSEATALMAHVAGRLGWAIRTALLLNAGARGADDAPGVVVVDKAGSIVSTTMAADRWLDLLEDERHTAGRDRLPVSVEAVLAQLVRGTDAPSPRARVQALDGTWLVVHGAELHGGDAGQRVVVIEKVAPRELASVIVRAYGLSPRERQVAELVCGDCRRSKWRGHSTCRPTPSPTTCGLCSTRSEFAAVESSRRDCSWITISPACSAARRSDQTVGSSMTSAHARSPVAGSLGHQPPASQIPADERSRTSR